MPALWGHDITLLNESDESGEPKADLLVKAVF